MHNGYNVYDCMSCDTCESLRAHHRDRDSEHALNPEQTLGASVNSSLPSTPEQPRTNPTKDHSGFSRIKKKTQKTKTLI